MKRRKVLSFILALSVLLSFSPLFTIQADAFSTGSTTIKKFRTVTIQPGKTYKVPAFKIKSKKTFQVPIYIKVSPKSKKDEITKGGYQLSLKNSKGKVLSKYKTSLIYVGKENEYYDWIYFNKGGVKSPCYSKGKYSFTIKNTSNCAIKVRYAVKGYTKFASKAEFSENMTVDYNSDTTDFKYLDGMLPYVYIGRIGPGMPVLEDIYTSTEEVYVDAWRLTYDGKLYIYIDTDEKEADTVVSIKLLNNKTPYNINFKVFGYSYSEDEDEEIDE